MLSLHARAERVQPGSWEDPSLAQIWFRGGADYIVPRADVGVFTLGCYPRDPERQRELEQVADAAHRVLDGRMLRTREVYESLGIDRPYLLRMATATGRLLIRWNASMIWLIGTEPPDLDVEDARRELARRFLRWFGPQTEERFRWWTSVTPADATTTWKAIRSELEEVDVGGQARYVLGSDVDALVGAAPITGVRLLPADDPWTKIDHDLLVPDPTVRAQAFPGSSPGYIPGVILVDGEVVGAWQRQQRAVTLHPARKLTAAKDALEAEALSLPIASKATASVTWT
ncbi:MAG: DNA glycosylase AlkZ-like family protein [Acidimicrobiales bacterium]